MAILNANQSYTYTMTAVAPSPYNGAYTYQWYFDGVAAGTSSTQAKTWTVLGSHITACTVTNASTGEVQTAYEADSVSGSAEGSTSSTISSYFMGITTGNTGEIVMLPGPDSTVGGGGFMPSASWITTPPNSHVIVYNFAGDTFTASTTSFGLSQESSTTGASVALHLQDGTIFCSFQGGLAAPWDRKCFTYNYSNGTITSKPSHPSTVTIPFNDNTQANVMSHYVMLLPSGKVFSSMWVSGGTTATWLYDPGTSTWSTSVAIPFQPDVRDHVRCCVDQTTGYVYAYCSINSSFAASGAIYRWKEGDVSWTLVGTDPVPRYSHAMAAINGKLLVCGGKILGGLTYTNTCYVVDGTSGVWTQLGNWPQSPTYCTAAVADSGRVYIWGYIDGVGGQQGTYAGYYNVTWAASTAPVTVSLAAHYRPVGGSLYVRPGTGYLYNFGGFSDVFLKKALSVYLP